MRRYVLVAILCIAAIIAARTPEAVGQPSAAAGPAFLVKDINTTTGDSEAQYLTLVGDVVYFSATDGVNGAEIWKSDGSASGTTRMGDIKAGAGGSSPSYLTVVNGTLFFAADDGEHGSELWRSDGTEEGTVMVKDTNPGPGNAFGTYCSTYSGLSPYVTDANGLLVFAADDGLNGSELWVSDGTTTGTGLLQDSRPAPPTPAQASSRWSAVWCSSAPPTAAPGASCGQCPSRP